MPRTRAQARMDDNQDFILARMEAHLTSLEESRGEVVRLRDEVNTLRREANWCVHRLVCLSS